MNIRSKLVFHVVMVTLLFALPIVANDGPPTSPIVANHGPDNDGPPTTVIRI